MEILWNQINLHRPPYRSWDVSIIEYDPRKFIESINKILSDFKSFQLLHSEAALLSRLIYRMKSKFRSDKGLKQMEKVNRALLNYLNMTIEREFELLKEYVEINNGIVSLPSRQSLEYVLVRTQGFAKLMCRVESTASIAGLFLKSRLQIGQSWTVAMIAYGVVSRIWILSRNIVKKLCIWYSSILNYTRNFKAVGISWLPENYMLPESLAEWLNLPWFNEDIEKLPLKEYWEKSIFSLIKTSDKDDLDLNIASDSKERLLTEKSEEVNGRNESITVQKDNDLGQRISRDDYEVIGQNNNNKKGRKKTKNLLEVQSEKDVVALLKTERLPGFDKLQLKILQKKLKKLLLKLTKKKSCELNEEMLKRIRRTITKWNS